jgi:Family of unknown function (DUF6186)
VVAWSARLGRWDTLILLYAVLAALCRPLTAPAAAVVLLPGAALLALAAWRRVPPRRTVCSRRSVVPWAVLALLFGGCELTAALWGNDGAHLPSACCSTRFCRPTRVGFSAGSHGWRGSVAGDPVTAYLVILVGFAGLIGAMFTVEMLGRAGREPFQPVARVLGAALASHNGRWVMWGVWLWIGFHFLAR